jgi:hypothetical protein
MTWYAAAAEGAGTVEADAAEAGAGSGAAGGEEPWDAQEATPTAKTAGRTRRDFLFMVEILSAENL